MRNGLDLVLAMCPGWGIPHPPVGISYLKGFLTTHGIKVRCLDLNLDSYKVLSEQKYWDISFGDYFLNPELFEKEMSSLFIPLIDKWAKEIVSLNPRVVGLSLFKSNVDASVLLGKRIKELNADLVVVGGGAETTRYGKIWFGEVKAFAPVNKGLFDAFDALIIGEGEYPLLEILSLLRQNQDYRYIDGMMYNVGGRVVKNRLRSFIDNLDSLSLPDFSDFELPSYATTALPLVTSRGCINRCTFCTDSPLWKIYRCSSPQKVLEDIENLVKKYNIRNFEIVDSLFNGDIVRVEEICELLIESELNITWSAKVSLRKEMSATLLKKMKKAGCTCLGYGVESGSPGVLRDMRKYNDAGKMKQIIADTHKAGIEVKCCFIIGYPTETEEDFQMTLDFIRETGKSIDALAQAAICHIEEESYLGLNLEKCGISFKDDGWHSKESTPQIRIERLRRFKEVAIELYKRYECEVKY